MGNGHEYEAEQRGEGQLNNGKVGGVSIWREFADADNVHGKGDSTTEDENLARSKDKVKLVVDRDESKTYDRKSYAHNSSKGGFLAQEKEREDWYERHSHAGNKTRFTDGRILQAYGLAGIAREEEDTDESSLP
jgi:hypothetical protein